MSCVVRAHDDAGGELVYRSVSARLRQPAVYESEGPAVLPLAADKKSAWIRIAELGALYFAVGALGFLLESRLGNRIEQGWQFYAITSALFIVFAFPGFTYQYTSSSAVDG